MSDDDLDRLLAAARDARGRAYAPYSGFAVGAAVLATGAIYPGANVENASYSVTLCAERVAASAAVAGGARQIDAVAVVGSAERVTPPCGACRQFLNEFGSDMVVVAESPTGERTTWSLAELLPHAFGPEFLK